MVDKEEQLAQYHSLCVRNRPITSANNLWKIYLVREIKLKCEYSHFGRLTQHSSEKCYMPCHELEANYEMNEFLAIIPKSTNTGTINDTSSEN